MSDCKHMIRTYGGVELCDSDSRILVVCIGYNKKARCGCPNHPDRLRNE